MNVGTNSPSPTSGTPTRSFNIYYPNVKESEGLLPDFAYLAATEEAPFERIAADRPLIEGRLNGIVEKKHN